MPNENVKEFVPSREYAEKLARVKIYVRLGYSAERISELLELDIGTVRMIKRQGIW